MRIVLCYPNEMRHRAQIEATAPGSEVIDAGQDRIATELPEADVFCGHPKVPVPWDEVVARGRLRWIQSSAAGLDHCLVPSVIASEIVVTSASGVLADQVGEQTLALLLGLLRGLPTFFRAQQAREFIRRPTGDLHGSTVGIVGLGGNGRRLAELLSVFRVRILATDWYPQNKPACVAELWPPERLPDLLAKSDVVILCVPLNPVTQEMICKETLRQFKRGALLINVARGLIVVEADLVDSLRSGQLGGAGLDVTEQEPLSPDSQLWGMPNVIITPHVGGQSARRADDITNFFCDNLGRFLVCKPLRNIVDKQLGFPRPA